MAGTSAGNAAAAGRDRARWGAQGIGTLTGPDEAAGAPAEAQQARAFTLTGPDGLTRAEATARLAAEGRNELPSARRRPFYRIVLNVLREPMLAMLLAGGVVYVLIGEPRDSLILLGLATLSILITVIQETRTERVLEALQALTSPRARVIRDGQTLTIDSLELVRGDLLLLAEGDNVPADALLLAAENFRTDESTLTGESVPVSKRPATPAELASGVALRPGGDGLPLVFSGTLVVSGQARAQIVATGPMSEIGRIGKSLATVTTSSPRLQAQTRWLIYVFAGIGGVVTLAAVVLYGALRGAWLDGLLAGLALGMSMLPEEFPVVLSVFMAMGAWRISRQRVLTRHGTAIESLGAATVLCTDKTGTLTQNRMAIAELRLADGQRVDDIEGVAGFDEARQELLDYGRLASATDPFDPMEKALHAAAPQNGERLGAAHTVSRAYGLTPELLAMTQVWRSADVPDDVLVATKGAPEAIAALCHLDADAHGRLAATVDDMASRGLRVLAVAKASHGGDGHPDSPHDFTFSLLGLVGFADPLRPGVPEAIADCRRAGVRVVMITGDYPATAMAIARTAGLDAGGVLSGDRIEGLSDADLQAEVRTVSVFARILPEQKLRIVQALKANGEIVAMTGDGVNDAPSLRAADIGVAMGKRGTDVARAAAAVVLLDDDFTAIVAAMRLGRRIYDNLRKAMAFIVAVHVPVAGLALLPLLFGTPLIFGPVQIAFLEMIVDPACTLVFEAEREEDDIMGRPPRRPDEPLFSPALLVWAVLQGLVILALTAGAYVAGLSMGTDAERLRGIAFFGAALGIVSLIFVNRAFGSNLAGLFGHRNRALQIVVVVVAAVTGLAILWPASHDFLGIGPLETIDWLTIAAIPAIALAVLEATKLLFRRQLHG